MQALILLLFASATCFVATLPIGASAQTYPDRPIKIVIPFPAGSASDVSTRRMADELRKRLGQPVIIDNQAGADGILAAQTAKRAMLSAVLVHGGLSLRDPPFPAILDDSSFARLRSRVVVGVDPDIERELPNGRGAHVAITTQGGSTFSRRVDWPRGHSRRGGTTWTDLSEKWHDALPDRDVGRMLALAARLDDLDDASALSEAFTLTH